MAETVGREVLQIVLGDELPNPAVERIVVNGLAIFLDENPIIALPLVSELELLRQPIFPIFRQQVEDQIRQADDALRVVILRWHFDYPFSLLPLGSAEDVDDFVLPINIFPLQTAELAAPDTAVQAEQDGGFSANVRLLQQEGYHLLCGGIAQISGFLPLHLRRICVLRCYIEGDDLFLLRFCQDRGDDSVVM